MANTTIVSASQLETAFLKLHEIVNTELLMLETSRPGYTKDLVNYIVGINSAGLFSKEVMDDLYSKQSTDPNWWRVWGSVASRYTFYLRTTLGISLTDFSDTVRDSINVYGPEIEAKSFTPPERTSGIWEKELGEPRFRNPADFWIICFFIFRQTIGVNEKVVAILEESADPKKQALPRAADKPRSMEHTSNRTTS